MQIEVYTVQISFKVERAAKVVQMEVKGTKDKLYKYGQKYLLVAALRNPGLIFIEYST